MEVNSYVILYVTIYLLTAITLGIVWQSNYVKMSTFGLLHDIITYSAGSLFIGLLLTVVLIAILFIIIKGFFPKSTFSPLSILVGFILTLFLGYRMVSLCGAVSLKWMCDDFENYISSLIPQGLQDEQLIVDKQYSDQLIESAKEEFPIFSSFVDTGTFTGQSIVNLPHVMADELNSFLNQFIITAILWSLFYLAVAAGLVIWTMKKEWDYRLNQKRNRSSFPSSINSTRAGHTSRGHSRSSRLRR